MESNATKVKNTSRYILQPFLIESTFEGFYTLVALKVGD
jgi:hypothetical protein